MLVKLPGQPASGGSAKTFKNYSCERGKFQELAGSLDKNKIMSTPATMKWLIRGRNKPLKVMT